MSQFIARHRRGSENNPHRVGRESRIFYEFRSSVLGSTISKLTDNGNSTTIVEYMSVPAAAN